MRIFPTKAYGTATEIEATEYKNTRTIFNMFGASIYYLCSCTLSIRRAGPGVRMGTVIFGVRNTMRNLDSAVYDLNWSTGENTGNNCSLHRHAYDFGNIHAQVPVAPIPNHPPHTPEIHPQHIHIPRLHTSSFPGGSVSFNYPSPEFPDASHILGHFPPLPLAPPVSRAGGLPAAINVNVVPVDISTLPHCSCIYNFLISITLLKAHLTRSPIPFQATISTSRSAIATAMYSLSCQTCQSDGTRNILSNDVECISTIFLGALLPMICIFYSKALESIEQMTGNQTARIEGQEMDIALETWKEMARLAMVKEASRVNKLVDEVGKLRLKNNIRIRGVFCYTADDLWEALCCKLSDLTRNANPRTKERVLHEKYWNQLDINI
ncbi:hypothetical protein EV426DRAFT_233535 [Tirmania nivea]|nr:hypothetical protein EV426DRAFT_233535 [Tirmania nivea]